MRRTCDRVRVRLPRLADATLVGWQRWFVQRHLAHCDDCSAEWERQLAVEQALRGLREAPRAEPDPPDDLLDVILARVHDPGVRQRVARRARGAVSGARPELSAAALLVAGAVVYLVWRVARAVVERVEGGRRASLG